MDNVVLADPGPGPGPGPDPDPDFDPDPNLARRTLHTARRQYKARQKDMMLFFDRAVVKTGRPAKRSGPS